MLIKLLKHEDTDVAIISSYCLSVMSTDQNCALQIVQLGGTNIIFEMIQRKSDDTIFENSLSVLREISSFPEAQNYLSRTDRLESVLQLIPEKGMISLLKAILCKKGDINHLRNGIKNCFFSY